LRIICISFLSSFFGGFHPSGKSAFMASLCACHAGLGRSGSRVGLKRIQSNSANAMESLPQKQGPTVNHGALCGGPCALLQAQRKLPDLRECHSVGYWERLCSLCPVLTSAC
jgi:hypothetical protein